MRKLKANLPAVLLQIFMSFLAFCIPVLALPKNDTLPAEVVAAKSIYLEDQKNDQAVLDAAYKQFSGWGRFTIKKSKDDADLVVIFTHKNGMDKWGFIGLTVMDVFVKGHNEPVFESKSALKTIFDPQMKTKVCITDFENHVERKN
jgi:hypothetical protein